MWVRDTFDSTTEPNGVSDTPQSIKRQRKSSFQSAASTMWMGCPAPTVIGSRKKTRFRSAELSIYQIFSTPYGFMRLSSIWQAGSIITERFSKRLSKRLSHASSKSLIKKPYSRFVPSPGSRFPLTANIFPVVPATKPSTCLVYCSTCRLFNMLSNLEGSVGSLKSLCHSSSGSKGCFDNDRAAFSAFLLVCHCCILACSRASARE
jgi:hypothetical protein